MKQLRESWRVYQNNQFKDVVVIDDVPIFPTKTPY